MDVYISSCAASDGCQFLAKYPTIIDNPVIDNAGNTFLHYYAYEGHDAEIRYLLSCGMNPNIVNLNGESALHWAAKMGSIQAAMALVDGGINLDIQDSSGSTALHCAIEAAIPELIPVLVSGGCNSLIADNDGKIPLDIANENADINNEYFATQLLLERLTTVSVMQQDDGFPQIKKGDVVFVRRKKPEVVTSPATDPALEKSPLKNHSPEKPQSQLPGKRPNTADKTKGAATRPQSAQLRLTPEEEAAMKEWKEKKRAQEEAKRASKPPPFYARAALAPYQHDTYMSSTMPAPQAGSTGQSSKLVRSLSEAVLKSQATNEVANGPENSDKQAILSSSSSGNIEAKQHMAEQKQAKGNGAKQSSAELGDLQQAKAIPIAEAKASETGKLANGFMSNICFVCEVAPTNKTPSIWSRISSKADKGNTTIEASSSSYSGRTTVNIDQLLELDKPPNAKPIAPPPEKPLWFVSKDKHSHLSRNPSPDPHSHHHNPQRERDGVGKAATDAVDRDRGNSSSTNAAVIPGGGQDPHGKSPVMDNYFPFLPSDKYSRCLDVYVSVETCHNCSEHKWLAWHDEDKYDLEATKAIRVVLSAIAECGFPVRVFAYKVKAEHTRLSALEVNIAVRKTNTSSDASSAAGSSSSPSPEQQSQSDAATRQRSADSIYHSLDHNLKWLSHLSNQDNETDENESDNMLEMEDEQERMKGLHGNHWAVANLHSKLETLKWPSKRHLQMKTILFLTTALCGEDFALEYSKLVFFDKPTANGHGVGVFRRQFVKKSKKAKQSSYGNSNNSSNGVEAKGKEEDGESISYQIDVVSLYQQWKLFKRRQQQQQQQVGGDNEPNSLSASNFDDFVVFWEQRRQIRSELDEAWAAWEKRLNDRVKLSNSNALFGKDNKTDQTSIAEKDRQQLQQRAATAFLMQSQQSSSALTGASAATGAAGGGGNSSIAASSNRLREFYTWGTYFDPVLVAYGTQPSTKYSTNHVVLGPSAMPALRALTQPSNSNATAVALQAKHPGLSAPDSAPTAVAAASSLSAAIAHRTPLSSFDIDVAQLHALCLYFVMDHTPCASLEYVPPYATKITEVASNAKTKGGKIQPGANNSTEPMKRVTLRMSRSPSAHNLAAMDTRAAIKMASTKDDGAPLSSSAASSTPTGGAQLGRNGSVGSSGAGAGDVSNSAGLRMQSRASMLQRISYKDSNTVSDGTSSSSSSYISPSVPSAMSALSRMNSSNFPMNRDTTRPGMVTTVEDDILENEYNCLLQRLQDDEKLAATATVTAATGTGTGTTMTATRLSSHKISLEEGSDESEDELSEVGRGRGSHDHKKQHSATNHHHQQHTSTAAIATKMPTAVGGARQSMVSKSGSVKQTTAAPGNGNGRSASKSPGRTSRIIVSNNANSDENKRASAKGLFAARPTSVSPVLAVDAAPDSKAVDVAAYSSIHARDDKDEAQLSLESATANLIHRISNFRDPTADYGISPSPGPQRTSSINNRDISPGSLSQKMSIDNNNNDRDSVPVRSAFSRNNSNASTAGNNSSNGSNSRPSWSQTPSVQQAAIDNLTGFGMRELKPSEIIAATSNFNSRSNSLATGDNSLLSPAPANRSSMSTRTSLNDYNKSRNSGIHTSYQSAKV